MEKYRKLPYLSLLPPANEVCEGYVFTGVCHSVHRGGVRGCSGGVGGGVRGCSWGGMGGCSGGACVVFSMRYGQ